jgi:catechol 1,2-dioxygenase
MAEITPGVTSATLARSPEIERFLDRIAGLDTEGGTARTKQIVRRIVGDLFRTIDDFDVSPDEVWAAVDWLTRLGQSGQAGLITAGLGFDRLLDIRSDEADARAGRTGGTPRAIEG